MGGGWLVSLTRGLLTHAKKSLVCCQLFLIRRFMTRVINHLGSRNSLLILLNDDGLNGMDPSLIILYQHPCVLARTIDEKGVLEVHFGVPVIEDGVLYDLTDIKRDVLNGGEIEQCPFRRHLANIRCRNETRGDKMVPHLRDIGQVFGLEVHGVPLIV